MAIAPNPLNVPPQETPLSNPQQLTRGGSDSTIFSIVWWKYFGLIDDWITYIQSEIDNFAPSSTSSYINDLGVLSGGTTNITSPATPNAGDLLTVAWQQPNGGGSLITWDAIFQLVNANDNDTTANIHNSVSFKGRADNKWWMDGVLVARP